jgi:hypothetical protein
MGTETVFPGTSKGLDSGLRRNDKMKEQDFSLRSK